MKRMQAIKTVRYGKILRVPGTDTEVFDARPADAKALIAIGKAKYAPENSKRAPVTAHVTVNKALTAQDPGKGGGSDRYLRRDVTTDDLANKELEAEKERQRKAAEQQAKVKQEAAVKRAAGSESTKGKNEGRSSKTGE